MGCDVSLLWKIWRRKDKFYGWWNRKFTWIWTRTLIIGTATQVILTSKHPSGVSRTVFDHYCELTAFGYSNKKTATKIQDFSWQLPERLICVKTFFDWQCRHLHQDINSRLFHNDLIKWTKRMGLAASSNGAASGGSGGQGHNSSTSSGDVIRRCHCYSISYMSLDRRCYRHSLTFNHSSEKTAMNPK